MTWAFNAGLSEAKAPEKLRAPARLMNVHFMFASKAVREVPGKLKTLHSEQTEVLIRLQHGYPEARRSHAGEKERLAYSI